MRGEEVGMTYRTILVELNAAAPAEERLEAARALATRFDARLVGMHVVPPPVLPVGDGLSGYIPPETIEAQRQANLEVRYRALAAFRRVCGEEGPKLAWREAEGPPSLILAEAARSVDLVVTGRADSGVANGTWLVGDLATAAGVPVLMVPSGVSAVAGHTVLVAWNGRREAARAAHDALPFLQAAREVVLCAIGKRAAADLEDAAAMLKRHGVPVWAERLEGADAHAGEILLAQAVAHRADLLVMGAYGHSRLREFVFGGATRHVLHHAEKPVLLSS
jgi:nucleotide-binding universal stress UspA family protein